MKIPRAAECLSSFNMCEAKDVPQNGMSYQMHSTSVCMNLCYLELDTCPFPGEGKKAMFDALSWLQMSEYREQEGMKT